MTAAPKLSDPSTTPAISVNGKMHVIPPGGTVAILLQQLGVAGRFAVEVNKQIVPRSRHADYSLQSGDRVEIVQAIGGG